MEAGFPNDITKVVEFLAAIGYPIYEWDLVSVVVFSEHRRTIAIEGRRVVLAKFKDNSVQKKSVSRWAILKDSIELA